MKLLKKILKFMTEYSVTSFGDWVYRPRWKSVISDLVCLFTFGLIKPRRRLGEKCVGDFPSE